MTHRKRKRKQFYGYYTRKVVVSVPLWVFPPTVTTHAQRTQWFNLMLKQYLTEHLLEQAGQHHSAA